MYQNIQAIKTNKTEFISLNLAKQYLRIDHDADDDIIQNMIEMTVVVAENYLGIKLFEAIWKITIYENLPSLIKLFHGPISQIESFKIYQPNGELFYLNEYNYCFDQFTEIIRLRQQHIIEKAEIIYHTGYTSSNLPAPIKQGFLEYLAKIYDMRGSDQGIPYSVKSLYQPYKRVRF